MNWFLPGATALSQYGPGRDGNKVMLRIPQSSGITGVSTSNYFVSYPGQSLAESYFPAEMHPQLTGTS